MNDEIQSSYEQALQENMDKQELVDGLELALAHIKYLYTKIDIPYAHIDGNSLTTAQLEILIDKHRK